MNIPKEIGWEVLYPLYTVQKFEHNKQVSSMSITTCRIKQNLLCN
jgi:hypothetical protein